MFFGQPNKFVKNNFVLAFVCVLLAAACFFITPQLIGARASQSGVFENTDSTVQAIESQSMGWSAECMVTIERSTNRVLYAKNEHKKRPMASVTKILTAITVLENCADLESKRVVPPQAAGVEGSSIYLEAGEKISMLDLLYGLMLQSGNDCAAALAILTAGSLQDFALLMNKTAHKTGAVNSNFVNPHGLHNDNHYTTAYDLALITSYAMKNEIFKEIASAKSRKIERTRENAPTLIVNKNKLLHSFDGADGVKTGFTKKAGRCLVSSATRDGMQVISVVLNCGPMFEDCAALMNRAFSEYKLTKIAASGEFVARVGVKDGKFDTVRCGVAEDLYYPLKKDERFICDINVQDFVTAPFKKGGKVGDISYALNNRLLFRQELFTIEDAPAMSLAKFLKRAIGEW